MNYFFVDAETDGLYGSFLSAAVLVTDAQGSELEHFYGAAAANPAELRSSWVKENVLPYLKNAECRLESEYALLEAVWALWMKYRESSFAVADVMHPVESRLFTECVRHDPENREPLAPYPFLDLSTLLLARNVPWDAERRTLSSLDLPPHDPLNDVRTAAEIWHRLL